MCQRQTSLSFKSPTSTDISAGVASEAKIVVGNVVTVMARFGAEAGCPAETIVVSVPFTMLSPKKQILIVQFQLSAAPYNA